MNIGDNIKRIKETIPDNVKLIAISKTKPTESILEAYESGHKIFGENKVQELIEKHEKLPDDIEWHMVGHLQRNKVKYIAPFIHLIHSVDSLKLLKEINKQGEKHKRIISCLLQLHIAKEETKFGLSQEEIEALLKSEDYQEMKNIRITGLMGMATFTDDASKIREEFRLLKTFFKTVKDKYFNKNDYFSERSMGMSGDYKIAIEEGSTMVRIGSIIFGERNYN